ncbi:hypothetical protein WOC76_11165 [Methylocystis sp. IM3]|uniref:hypothetical protein n=1 Tax=unclassified Methylocystis TaxID=2625913 RepID=UPI0030FCF360
MSDAPADPLPVTPELLAAIEAQVRAFKTGWRAALKLTPAERAEQLLVLRDADIRTYANTQYEGYSQRQKAENVARDMLRHRDVRDALGGEALSAGQIRKILTGGRS